MSSEPPSASSAAPASGASAASASTSTSIASGGWDKSGIPQTSSASSASASASVPNPPKPPVGGLLNLGGPGWFSDVFTVEIRLDTPRKAAATGFLIEEHIPLFRSDEKITGAVVVAAPPNCSVSHYGIRVDLESSIQFYESLNSVPITVDDAATGGVDASGEGVVAGTTAYRFELDLSKMRVKEQPLPDSYDGQKFDVRHSLVATVKRPWYTFNVTQVQAIAIQTVAPAPPTDELARRVPVQLGVVSREPKIVVDDCGGVATFSFGRSHWNLGDTLVGTIDFSEMTKPLTMVKLILYKIEIADGDTEERSVKELDVVAPPQPAPAEGDAPAPAPAPNRRTEPITGPETLHVAFALTADKGAVISPTYDELLASSSSAGADAAADGNQLNVHYYLRLLVESEDGRAWNTSEIILYRSSVQALADVDHV